MAAVVAAKVKRNRDSGRGGRAGPGGHAGPLRPTPGVGGVGMRSELEGGGPAQAGFFLDQDKEAKENQQRMKPKFKPNPSAEYYKRVKWESHSEKIGVFIAKSGALSASHN